MRCGGHEVGWFHTIGGQCTRVCNNKLCCYVIRPVRSARAADSPREICWTVSRNNTVLSLSHDVKKFNQYLPLILTSLNVSDSRFRKLVIFLMWRHHDMVLWHHGGGAWQNGLILTTVSNGNSWADVANHVIRLCQAGDTENFERRIMG